MTLHQRHYPVGTPGVSWKAEEKSAWFSHQTPLRSYEADVLSVIREQQERGCAVSQYGELDYGERRYPLYAIRSADWRDDLPVALITGGVHGYETSGVHGALRFAFGHMHKYAGRINILVAPCVSPWGYETIQRWNPLAVDPNRSFRERNTAQESDALLDLLAGVRDRVLLHIDLHETTDTDESEFRPALAARDGQEFVPDSIPDGFYLVADEQEPCLEFQSTIIEAVSKITHIAAPDSAGKIIGKPVVAPGVIEYRLRELGLCAGITDARFRTTTEVYPDSPRATPEQCILAQVAAANAALGYALTSC